MHPIYRTCLIRSAFFAGLFLMPSLALGQDVKSTNAGKAPLMKLLPRFEGNFLPSQR